jgi:hypothetical protein
VGAVREDQCLDLGARAGVAARGVYLPPDPRPESPHGVHGIAPAATRDKGEALVAAARALAGFVRSFHA